MNLRQAQRSLAELISKCEAAHIQLPEDPLEARAEAVEAIVHSLEDQKANLADAQDELLQKFGLELVWKQQLEKEEAKRQRRRLKKGANRGEKADLSPAEASKSLGYLLEAPLVSDQPALGLLQHGNTDDAQVRKPNLAKAAVMTPTKRPAASQRFAGMKVVARKAKHTRDDWGSK